MNFKSFFAELKRRHVYKIAVGYAVAAWLLIQVVTQVFPFFELPKWSVQVVVLAAIVGFPIALILSWAFELTPEGIKRDEEAGPRRSRTRQAGRKLTALIIVVAALAAGVTVFRLLHSARSKESARQSARATPIESKSIAVLPFANLSGADARTLIVCTPAGFERYFDLMAARAAGVEPPAEAMEPWPEVITVGPRIGQRQGGP